MASITKYQGREIYQEYDLRTAEAGEDIAKDRQIVKFESRNVVIKCTADTDVACGLIEESCADGAQCQFITRGRLRFIATGDVAIGDPLCPDDGTAGNMRTAVSGDRYFGVAVEAAATGEYAFGEFDFSTGGILLA